MRIEIPAWVDGSLTPVEKLEVHQRGLKHRAVSVFVMRGDVMLLQKRALSKYHTPGLWANTCCTHPEWNEATRDCAVRRLREELGLEGLSPVFRETIEYRADVGDGLIEHEVVDVFLAEAESDLTLDANPDEVMEVRWISLEALKSKLRDNPEEFTPWLKIYMTRYSQQIFGDALPA